MPASVCETDPRVQTYAEEDLPIHQRRRVRAWAASQMGSLPCPLLGSSERGLMLNDAQHLEQDAEALFQKDREQAELLREQAYQKRALCAPIRLLPHEILSQILVLATPESFAFRVPDNDIHPLCSVSRSWLNAIKTSPEIWSRLILYSSPPYQDEEWQAAERRLPSWLARAGSSSLEITIHITSIFPSSAALQAVWLQLLSVLGDWGVIFYVGPSELLNQFWEHVHSAVRLDRATFEVTGPPAWGFETEDIVDSSSSCNPTALPRLQELTLSNEVTLAVIRERLPFAMQLQSLTLTDAHYSEHDLSRLAASFSSVTKLHLEDIDSHFLETAATPMAAFERLEHFEFYGSGHASRVQVLPALQGCRALKSLRLQYEAFRVTRGACPLPSVERLELELHRHTTPDSVRLKALFMILPSLRSLKLTSRANGPRHGCETRTLLDLLKPGDPIGRTLCPQLSEICFRGAIIFSRDLVTFIENRTANVAPETSQALAEYGEDWWEKDTNRNTRYADWKPTCVVTTLNCFEIPDMVGAGLHSLVDCLKNAKPRVEELD